MNVLKIPPQPLLFVTPHETVAQCIAMMNARVVGSILIMQDDVLKGIFTERDVLRLLPVNAEMKLDQPVSDFMTKNPRTIPATTTLDEAELIMKQGRFRHLPIETNGSIVNVISSKDIFDARHSHDSTTAFQQTIRSVVAMVSSELTQPIAAATKHLETLKSSSVSSEINELKQAFGKISKVITKLSNLEAHFAEQEENDATVTNLEETLRDLTDLFKAG